MVGNLTTLLEEEQIKKIKQIKNAPVIETF